MFTLNVTLSDQDGVSTEGVVSAYMSSDRSLVAREISLNGEATLDLASQGELILTVASTAVFTTTLVIVPDDSGVGSVALTGISDPLIPPIGPEWCSVHGRFLDPLGRQCSAGIKARLLTGNVVAEDGILINKSGTAYSLPDGRINIQLLRGGSYALVLYDAPLTNYPSEYTVFVPNAPNAQLDSILYPFITSGIITPAFAGVGAYEVSVIVSDGRTLSDYATIVPLIFAVEADDAEAELEELDGKLILRVSHVGGPGYTISLRGARRGRSTSPESGTTDLAGDTFLSLG